MPPGDKVFQDAVDLLHLTREALDVGYWKEPWGELSADLLRRLKKLCDVHRTVMGLGSTCSKECPFIELDGQKSLLCMRTGLIEHEFTYKVRCLQVHTHPKYNPSFKILLDCGPLHDFCRGLISEMLAIYYTKLPEVRQTKLGETGSGTKRRYKVIAKKNGSADAVIQPAMSYTANVVLNTTNATGLYGVTMTAPGWSSVGDGTATPCSPRFACRYCGTNLSTFQNLFQHCVNYHSKYICDNCGDVFDTQGQLDTHTVDNHMSYECEFCDSVFESEEDLDEHVRERHPPQVCGECGAEFNDEDSLSDHIAEAHPEPDPDSDENQTDLDEHRGG